jgi:hypothetical protein
MSDASRILADLDRHKKCFDLTEDGLGDKLLKIATDGVRTSLVNQCDADGNKWPELSEKYAEWKEFHYPGQPMGVLHFVMAQPAEIAGTVYVSTDEARTEYGVTAKAREEMEWFSKRRPFWGLTADSIAKSDECLDARFKSQVG